MPSWSPSHSSLHSQFSSTFTNNISQDALHCNTADAARHRRPLARQMEPASPCRAVPSWGQCSDYRREYRCWVPSCHKLVKLGASKVIIAVRGLAKGIAAKEHIEQVTGIAGVLDVFELDMLDYTSIRAFSKKVNSLKKLDVGILNAGIGAPGYAQSKYGWEKILQVNVISTTFLALYFCQIFAPARLQARFLFWSSPARVCTSMSPEWHLTATVDHSAYTIAR